MSAESAARPTVLTVAGTDSSGGAGVTVDTATIAALGGRPVVAVTAVTAQGAAGVLAVDAVAPATVAAQIDAVVPVAATKTGMLATAAIVEVVAERAATGRLGPVVVDPVLRASSGGPLLDEGGVGALSALLVPVAHAMTPNLAEAAALTGLEVSDRDGMRRAADALGARGPRVVVVTGGHLEGSETADLVWVEGAETWLEGARVPGEHRGTGCRFSAALATGLGAGLDPVAAARRARQAVVDAISGAAGAP